MVRISKVYTKGGDKGETSLAGGGRIAKDHPRVEAYGTVDELNSILGLVRYFNMQNPQTAQRDKFENILETLQNWLFDLGSQLATDPEFSKKKKKIAINESYVTWLEAVIDAMNEELEPLPSFTLPGGGIVGAHLHQARTVCRRAERRIITLSREHDLGEWPVPFINRLSDALFVFSRWTCRWMDQKELLWVPETEAPDDWQWK
ncbi:MAG: cob(I)yrinic acid a,c-diamide adenosyltransferase [Candidatus Nitronauta litoralis]|uniref:Corrinoid adenosyltransferase n=1 Tax=Candidatus Nitronauta litoralis TaxID=2705533 RepID=A0A7T0BYJ4_9BACT|nr:MAG: cob(I)yrinic acid a,c-diamide adenosyltransferase [Candidatus Nitronauta litoralis]